MNRFIIFYIATCLVTASHARMWTSTKGSKIDAEFVRLDDNEVVLKKSNGKELSVKISLLSKADQEFIKKEQAKLKSKKGTKKTPLHVRFWKDREPTRPNYDDKWPEKAEVLGVIEIEKVTEDEVKKEFIYRSPHYEFVSDVQLRLDVVKTFAKLFETTFEAMTLIPMSFDKARTSPPDHRYRVLLFADVSDYFKNGGPQGSGGVYMPRTDLIMIPLRSLGVKKKSGKYVLDYNYANQTLSHELVHQLMDNSYYKHGSLGWFTEGMAEYVSSSPYVYGRFTFRNNISTIKRSITAFDPKTRTGSNLGKKIKFPNLKRYMLQDYRSFTANGRYNYAMGMAITTYFIHMDDNGSRKNINAFLKAMRKGTKGEKLLDILLAGRSWDELKEDIATSWKKRGMVLIFD